MQEWIMSEGAEDTMLTPGSKIICYRQHSGRNGLEVPRKHGGVSYVMTLKAQSDLCGHSSTSTVMDKSPINLQVHNQTVVMTLAFLYQLNIGFSPFLVSVSST